MMENTSSSFCCGMMICADSGQTPSKKLFLYAQMKGGTKKKKKPPLQKRRVKDVRVVLDLYSFSSLVFGAGGNNALRHGMLHVVGFHVMRLHVVRVHVVARHLAHVHVRWGRAHVAVHVRGHARHRNVRVVDIAFGKVNAFFGLFEVFFRESCTIRIRVMGTTVLGEIVGAREGLVAKRADVRAFGSVGTDVSGRN